MKIELNRTEICDIMLALTAAHQMSDAEKWKRLHDKVKAMLDDYDNHQEELQDKKRIRDLLK